MGTLDTTILSIAFSGANESRRLAEAYTHLLLLPVDSLARARVQPVMATLRDTIAELSGYDAEDIQNTFEAFVASKPK